MVRRCAAQLGPGALTKKDPSVFGPLALTKDTKDTATIMTSLRQIVSKKCENESSAKVGPGQTEGRTAERFIIVN